MPTNSSALMAAWQAVQASYLAIREDLFQALWETVYMVTASTVFSLVFGFCWAWV